MSFGDALAALPDGVPTQRIGLAVSGGGDSVAMLRMVSDAIKGSETDLFIYSVDHGLRPEAAQEVRFVRELTERLGHTHRALNWAWDGAGNVQAAARKGRYDAIAKAAKQDGVQVVCLGHTKDDQAETLLMALARSAGVDGLSGMQTVKADRGVYWVRPLLNRSRVDLRAYLQGLDQTWVDDPSNDDTDYERVRMRNASQALAELGLTTEALAAVTSNMQSARHALETVAASAWQSIGTEQGGAIRLERQGYEALATDIQRRVLLTAIRFVAPNTSAPRRDAVTSLLKDLSAAKDTSMGGCLVLFKTHHIWVVREPAAVKDLESSDGQTWDHKWQIEGPYEQQLVIRALGENGLKCLKNWRDTGLPRPVLLSSPAIWRGERLIAAPIVGYGGEWSAKLLVRAEDFLS